MPPAQFVTRGVWCLTVNIDFRKLKFRTSKRFGDSPFESFEVNVSIGLKQVTTVDYFIQDDGTAVIESIYVVASHTGMGVGRFIIKKLEADLKHQGIHTVYLDSVESNAIGFWRALGYYPPSRGMGWRKPL